MTREQIVGVLTSMQRAWSSRDAEALAAVHADDCVVQSPIFGELRGRRQIARSYHDLFTAFADWTFASQELIVDGDRAAQLFTVHATHTSDLFGVPATHRRFTIQGVIVFQFAGGKIVAERRLYDFTGLLIQVGVIKARPAN